jgi:predicted secreted protein
MSDADVLTGRIGTPVSIRLQSVPSSGAIWYAAATDPGGELTALDPIARSAAPGGQVEQVFEFRATAPGTYRLQFELKRIWEPDVRGRRLFTVHMQPDE